MGPALKTRAQSARSSCKPRIWAVCFPGWLDFHFKSSFLGQPWQQAFIRGFCGVWCHSAWSYISEWWDDQYHLLRVHPSGMLLFWGISVGTFFSSSFFLKWTSSKRTLCLMGQRDENAFVHQDVSSGSVKIACWPVQKRENELEYSYR